MQFINKESFTALSTEDKAIYTTRSIEFKQKANGYSVVNARILSARPLGTNGNVLLSLSDKVIMSVIVPKQVMENAYIVGVTNSLGRMFPNLVSSTISFVADVSLTGDTWIGKDGVAGIRTSNVLTPNKTTVKASDELAFRLEMVAETIAAKNAAAQRAPIVQDADSLAPLGA